MTTIMWSYFGSPEQRARERGNYSHQRIKQGEKENSSELKVKGPI